MAPSKDAGVSGYMVAKVAEDKPADKAGVRHGWRLVSIAGKPCRDLDLEEIQVLMKGADLPLEAEFEREKVISKPSKKEKENDEDSEGDEEELDVLDVRAEHRMNNQAGIDIMDDLPVKRSPEDLPEPIMDWHDAMNRKLLNKSLVDKLNAAGLKRPTLIQRHAVPIVGHDSGDPFCHYDMIASAQTGSGKTFAFVIPTVGRLVVKGAAPRPFFAGTMAQSSPLVLVLSPTRELAMQTAKEIEVLIKGTSLTLQTIYGGESLKFQMQKLLQEQKDIICATPGRLVDLIDARKVSLSFVQSVVLDEADQMLEQSLEIMVQQLLTERDMPGAEGRQTLLFSATMPQKIRDMCPKILRQSMVPVRIANLTIGHYQEDKGGGCSSIKQLLRWVPEERDRIQAMVRDLNSIWIGQGKKGRVVVFVNQRVQAGMLQGALVNAGMSVLHLHGKLDQAVREEVFDKFRKGMADILVATNVASRGLDFPDITFVCQFNLPGTVDIYTHRIGRTGRVGQVGCALAYVGPKDRHLFPKLTEFLELNDQEVPSFLRPRDQGRDRRDSWRGRSRSRGGGKGKGKGYGRSRSRGRRRY
jgi:ATP-dependent RNA helicase DDX3X